MPSFEDVLQAKQVLSSRLLRAGFRGGVVGRSAGLSVSAVIAKAGQSVHAVGVGKKVVEGKVAADWCVRLYVVQKLAPSLLPPRDRLPTETDGIPTDVIESPPAFVTGKKSLKAGSGVPAVPPVCSQQRQTRQRPVVAGISTAHYQVTAGTLAYFCRSVRHGDDPTRVYALSNNHVFANLNQAQAGDPLYQPGPADGGTDKDHFANLHRFRKVQLGGLEPNRVDAAIGELLPAITYKEEVCSIGKITGTDQAAESLAVRKHGRTTGYTEGTVTDLAYDALVGMDHSDPSLVALFEGQMRIETVVPYPSFALPGDSGSLVVKKDAPTAVGLYFAGPPNGFYGVANQIHDVLTQLEIQLL
jgi:hypothetical protein